MKLLLSILVVISLNGFAQTPSFQWANSAGGFSWDLGRCVVSDASGNVIVTGYFQSPTITFGTTTLSNKDLSGNSSDFFIVKYNASGNVLWAKCFGGSGDDYSISIAIDSFENIFISGWFNSPTLIIGSATFSNPSGDDFFVTKLDKLGNVIWANSSSGINNESSATSVATDSWGNVFVAGVFVSSTLTIGSTQLANVGSVDMFLVKYDSLGNIVWAKSEGDSLADYASSVATDNSGNVFICGYFFSTKLVIGPTTLSNTGINDIFIAKFDSLGDPLWTKNAGGAASDWGEDIAIDPYGNAILTGWFESSNITFDSISLNGNFDIFTAKYDSSGNILWAKAITGNNVDYSHSITTDISGNVLVAGNFSSNILFFDNNSVVNPSTNSLIIVKYDSSGNYNWAKVIEGCNCGISIYGICTDQNGNAVVTGYYHSDTLSFDSFLLTNANNSTATSDYFVAKLGNITGINENIHSNELVNIYPNPSNGQITITSLNPINEITISDIIGQVIYHSKPSDNHLSLQLQNSGVYLITLTSGNQKTTKKLIVENRGN